MKAATKVAKEISKYNDTGELKKPTTTYKKLVAITTLEKINNYIKEITKLFSYKPTKE